MSQDDTILPNLRLSNDFYENLGGLPEVKALTPMDILRYRFVSKYVLKGSLLDVGAYYGDFLKFCESRGISDLVGTEINELRVNKSNELIGRAVVRKDFLHGELNSFDDSSVDTVVCMEVLEHIEDDRLALSELFRVARKRVIITVPFNEKRRTTPCIHCNKTTPLNGHIHVGYNHSSFDNEIPEGWVKKGTKVLGNGLTFHLSFYLPQFIINNIDPILRRVFKTRNWWILYIFDYAAEYK